LAECIDATKKELDASFLFCPIVGHVGDGNFHVVIVFDPNDPRESEEAHRLNSLMVRNCP
jgi:D-lactate dehydrogenase (cytochrome)